MSDTKFPIRVNQPLSRVIPLRIDGSAVTTSAATTGLLEGLNDCTIAKGSGATSNEVTVTFNTAFARVPVVVATPLTTNCHVEVKSITASTLVLETFQVADGTTKVDDADIHVIVWGWDSATQY
jgi:hypothetical protein